MKILFVISSLGIGGEQRATSIITEQLTLKAHSVDIATFNIYEKSLRFNENVNIKLIESGDGPLKSVRRLLAIRKLIKTNNYDIVVGFAVIPSIICSLSSIGIKTPVIVCERNDPGVYKRTWKLIRWFAYKFAAGAIFQTSDAKNYFKSRIGKEGIIIPNPLDIEKLPNWNGEYRKKRIVNTARLTDVKNQELLIKAFARIENDYPDYSLVIYGDGPKKYELTKLIEKLSLTKKVYIKEAIPNVLDEIVDDQIFVLPSNHEGFPNSLAEAMAIGLAVISTDCRIGGPKDMINNYENGLLIRVNNLNDLIDALKKCLSDEPFRNRIGNNAEKIRTELDANIISERWIKYLTLISGKEI